MTIRPAGGPCSHQYPSRGPRGAATDWVCDTVRVVRGCQCLALSAWLVLLLRLRGARLCPATTFPIVCVRGWGKTLTLAVWDQWDACLACK